jgi:hypothetical protein
LSGFDFTTVRDANIFIKSNIGEEDKKPHAKINLTGSAATQNIGTGNGTKLNYVNTDSYACKFTIANNKITYLPDYNSDMTMWVSINVQADTGQPADLKFGIVKNNTPAVYYGTQGIFIDQNDRSFHVSMNIYLDDVKKDDYFEIWCKGTASETIRVVDINWLIIAI